MRTVRGKLMVGLVTLLICTDATPQGAGRTGGDYSVAPGPWKQLAKLTESNGKGEDWLGSSVAISKDGNTAAIAAVGWCPLKGVDGCAQGAIFVFTKPAGGWRDVTETARLIASDGQPGEYLGASVAISEDGTTIVAGAPLWPANGKGNGAVYVFAKPENGWMDATETARLRTTDGTFVELGQSVAMSGHAIVAGGYGFKDLQGAAYVFVEPKGGGVSKTQTARLSPSDGAKLGELGWSVSISGNTVVVGAPYSGTNGEGNGAYVFVKPKDGWKNTTETAKLTASRGTGFKLGYSVSIASNTIAVGAPARSNDNGAVYIFVKPTQGWRSMTQTARLTVPPKFNSLGYSLSFDSDGKNVIAGAPGWQDGGGNGAVDLFVKPASGWTTTSKPKTTLTATGGKNGDNLGYSASMTASTIVTGAVNVTVGSNRKQGAAYVFGR